MAADPLVVTTIGDRILLYRPSDRRVVVLGPDAGHSWAEAMQEPSPLDPGALVDYSLAQLASQDEVDRGRFVRFAFDAPGQTVESTIAILATLDIASEQYAGGDSVELSSSDLDARYGSWPGEVPTLPAALGGAG
jgi:hypothetical protein